MQSVNSFRTLGLASVLVVAVSAAAAAQRPTPPPQAAPQATQHPAPAPQAAPQATQHPSPAPQAAPQATNHPTPSTADVQSFTGIAGRLGMTAQDLADAYAAALAANPKLTRGQFIAANIVAKNLGAKNSAITSEALLDGLANGNSIGQTLQGLGLSAGDAQNAEAEANREAHGGKPSGQ
jgi:Tfp pilus assembly protein FimV